MSDLTAFLLARLDEDEDRAKRAAFGWGGSWAAEHDESNEWSTIHSQGKRDMFGSEDGDVVDHIARHDPARVLADVQAKRAIVDLHQPDHLEPDICSTCGSHAENYPCRTLRHVAAGYADHSDYREEWRP